MQPRREADVILDASGEECPVPVEMAAARLGTMAPGEILCVRSTDPVSPIDFEAWCMRQPHEFLGAEEDRDSWEIRILKGGQCQVPESIDSGT
jgi:tRNA 2-thiouridine synthesizing protein A